VTDTNLSVAGHDRPVTAVEDLQLWSGAGPSVPGPTIFLCHGDTATVHLANHAARGTSVHWHGLYQRASPWADGVPGVTQCPVQPGESFLWYDFKAEPSGTFWYHSHSKFQRDDGLSGALVVREKPQPGVCDLTEHVIHLQDWFLSSAEERCL
jgi:FtsP/CotA-like multicopper oxidase with cupredoxin domain